MKIIFGDFLRKKRIQKGMSLRELSNKVGISHTYLEKIELGTKAPPNDNILIKIEKTLLLNETSKYIFYEIAAQNRAIFDTNNIYLPTDISAYLVNMERAMDFIRMANKFDCDNDFWNKLLQDFKKENMSQ